MTAKVGDVIVVESEKVGQADRTGEILEVIEAEYGTRYRVRWIDGHESTIRPAVGSAMTHPPVTSGTKPAAKPSKKTAKRSGLSA